MMNRLAATLLFFIVILLLSACSSISYYSQSIGGQLEIFFSQDEIDELLEDKDTSNELKRRLRLVQDMRKFSVEELKLPDNDSYRSYADLKRQHVVWNVFAATEFSTELKKWCFPFAGCVGYKGYFAEEDARTAAATMQEEGFEIHLAGISAYSTLGWFDDPILNTFVQREEPRLAGLIFHELAHQQLYIKNDTAFNESFASTVEMEGVRRWLDHRNEAEKITAYQQDKARRLAFSALINGAREDLSQIYSSDLSEDQKRIQKQQVIQQLRDHYQQLKNNWQGYNGYDRWFSEEINNAKLGSVAFYADWVPAFQVLLSQSNDDFSIFYEKAEALAELEPKEREKAMQKLQADSKLVWQTGK